MNKEIRRVTFFVGDGIFELVISYALAGTRDANRDAILESSTSSIIKAIHIERLIDKDKIKITPIVFVYISPTANCQVFSLGIAENLITGCVPHKGLLKEALKQIFKYVSGKSLVILDIKQAYVSYVKNEVNEKSIEICHNYSSTNGSLMAILMIRIKDV